MIGIALKMLARDRTKFFSIVIGLSFSVMLIVEQGSIFTGILRRTGAVMIDTSGIDLWVYDRRVRNHDDLRALKDTELYRVRSVPGVEWAVRYFKGQARAKRLNGDYENVMVLGLDDATLVGAPVTMIEGRISDLSRRDSVILDVAGAKKMGGVTVGEELQFNDHRAVVVGLCEVTRNFQSLPVVYTRYTQAVGFVPSERSTLSAILAKVTAGSDLPTIQRAITQETDLAADTPKEFRWKTVLYVLKNTGIAINFGVTVLLGLVVGAAISGQTFYTFAVDNLKQFGALKAMGASDITLAGMIFVQAFTVAGLGYGIGVGIASFFTRLAGPNGQLPSFMTPHLLGIAAVAVFVLCLVAGLIALRKVRQVEPAIVFR